MYCEFFGFSDGPFDVTMNPKYLYLSSEHRETVAVLVSGISERRGLMALVGDSGTGKTTLLRTMLGQLNEKTKVAYVSNTTVSFEEVLTMVLADLGIAADDETLSEVEALNRLNDFAGQQMARGGNVVLIVDEAQNLNGFALENLGLLLNQKAFKRLPIQVVLCGQPELDDRLKELEVSFPDDVEIVKRRTTPLGKEETCAYIQHHLDLAGYAGPTLLTRGAQRLVCKHSAGVPRNINNICDNALLTAYVQGKKTIKATLVKKTIEEMRWKPSSLSAYGQAPPPADKGGARSGSNVPHIRVVMATVLMFIASVFFVSGLLIANHRHEVKNGGFLNDHSATQGGSPTQSNGFPDFWEPIQEALPHNPILFVSASARVSEEDTEFELSAMMPNPLEHSESTGALSVTTRSASGAKTKVAHEDKRTSSSKITRQVSLRNASAAAYVLDFKKGTPEVGDVVVQVGSFRNRTRAEHLARSLKEKGYDVYLETSTLKDLGPFHRVRLRGYSSIVTAMAGMPQLRELGFHDAFIPSHQPQ
jgi:type II secretory pathway predicted ATPase ExeA/cell division septation protein DedD